MGRIEYTFPSVDGKHTIAARKWLPSGEPVGIVQLVHGMVEFIDRYDAFATFLADHGYLVVGCDLLGHGASVDSQDEWGCLDKEKGKDYYIEDTDAQRKLAQSEYGDRLPYFILGHSMGSFIVRAYIARHGQGLAGAIISGTGQTKPGKASAGNNLARFISATKGSTYRSNFLHNMADGAYNKTFEPARTPYDWLSRNTENVDRYAAEPRDTFMFSAGGYVVLTSLVKEIIAPACFKNTPSDLPLLIVSGEQDPVGDFGKGPKEAAELYRGAGIKDVTLILYPDDRHEILNELDRDKVYEDIASWLESHVWKTEDAAGR